MKDIIKSVIQIERPKQYNSIIDMESRGIHLNLWQLVEFSDCNRRIGKTFLSYCKVMYNHSDGKVITPVYDIDINNSHNRKLLWLDGFTRFLDKYYPEYIYSCSKHNADITLKLKPQEDIAIINRLDKIIQLLGGNDDINS